MPIYVAKEHLFVQVHPLVTVAMNRGYLCMRHSSQQTRAKTFMFPVNSSQVVNNKGNLMCQCSIVNVFVSAPECRDIETALYDRTYVRTSLANCVQYFSTS